MTDLGKQAFPINISIGLVEQLIASQFPAWKALDIIPVSQQGWDNRTFRLGITMSVRLPSSESYASQAEKEQTWLPILASKVPFQIPTLLARGAPSELFPYNWGVYRWIEGEKPELRSVNDVGQFAKDLAHFLTQLRQADVFNAPQAGLHSFYRGAPLSVYDVETRAAIQQLATVIDAKVAIDVWEKAVNTFWNKAPVWFHGDMATGNLLIQNGNLAAVLDFGCCGVGDPACDLAIAWTFLVRESRQAFKSALNVDENTWQRGKAWVLWKALITVNESQDNEKITEARKTLQEVLT